MSDILAIDLATKTGWCRGRVGETPEFGTMNFAAKKKGSKGGTDMLLSGDSVFAAALDWIGEMLDPVPDIVIIESMLPPEAMRNKTSRQVRDRLAGLHGVVRAVARRKGVGEISEASVGDVRAHFISQRNLKRDDAKRGVIDRCQLLGWDVANDNEADACALWSFACALIDPKAALSVVPLFNKALRVSVWPLTKVPGAGTRSR
jgi:crossover junction endodeoxyribonuclease RuvC